MSAALLGITGNDLVGGGYCSVSGCWVVATRWVELHHLRAPERVRVCVRHEPDVIAQDRCGADGCESRAVANRRCARHSADAAPRPPAPPTPIDERLLERVVARLDEAIELSAGQLSKQLGNATAYQVRSALVELARRGRVEQLDGIPPKWRLVEADEPDDQDEPDTDTDTDPDTNEDEMPTPDPNSRLLRSRLMELVRAKPGLSAVEYVRRATGETDDQKVKSLARYHFDGLLAEGRVRRTGVASTTQWWPVSKAEREAAATAPAEPSVPAAPAPSAAPTEPPEADALGGESAPASSFVQVATLALDPILRELGLDVDVDEPVQAIIGEIRALRAGRVASLRASAETREKLDELRESYDAFRAQISDERYDCIRAEIAEAAGLPLLGDGMYEGSDAELVREVESLREAATGRAVTRTDDLAAWMREHPAEAISAIRQARLVEATPDADGEGYATWQGTDWGAVELSPGTWSWTTEDESGRCRTRERAVQATRESLASAGWVVVDVRREVFRVA